MKIFTSTTQFDWFRVAEGVLDTQTMTLSTLNKKLRQTVNDPFLHLYRAKGSAYYYFVSKLSPASTSFDKIGGSIAIPNFRQISFDEWVKYAKQFTAWSGSDLTS